MLAGAVPITPKGMQDDQGWGDYITNVIEYEYDYFEIVRVRVRVRLLKNWSNRVQLRLLFKVIMTTIVITFSHSRHHAVC